MITSSLMTLEAANIFCGVGGHSNHLRLTDVKLPGYDEVYVDHKAGGAPIGIEIDVQVSKLQCDFTLAGWSPQVDALIGSWQRGSNTFQVFGAIRHRVTGNIYQAKATMTGRLGKADFNDWRRGSAGSTSYSVKAIIAYELILGGTTMMKWDFFENTVSRLDFTSTL